MKYLLILLPVILSGCVSAFIAEKNLNNPRKNVIVRTFINEDKNIAINKMTQYCDSSEFEIISKKEKTEIADDFIWLVTRTFIDIEFSCKDSNEKKVSSTNK